MTEPNENQLAAFEELNECFLEIGKTYGVGAAESAVVSLLEARWIMNSILKSPYADYIAETLSAANRGVNYIQRVIHEGLDEEVEIAKLVRFGMPGDGWDYDAIETIVADRRKIVQNTQAVKWNIRDYDQGMESTDE